MRHVSDRQVGATRSLPASPSVNCRAPFEFWCLCHARWEHVLLFSYIFLNYIASSLLAKLQMASTRVLIAPGESGIQIRRTPRSPAHPTHPHSQASRPAPSARRASWTSQTQRQVRYHDPPFPPCPHPLPPFSGTTAPYLVTSDGISECNAHTPKFSSWFVGDRILGDGALHLATPVDPLFLLLPALEKASEGGSFCDLEHCLECWGAGAAGGAAAAAAANHDQLRCLCDAKEAGGQRYYRLNEAKVLAWLKIKVNQAKTALTATAAGFAQMEDSGLTVYAAGLVGEYLSSEWSAKLEGALGLPKEGDAGAATSGPAPPPPYDGYELPDQAKKARFDPKEAARAKAAVARAEARAAKAKKEAAGMRKLSSFFAPKAKP